MINTKAKFAVFNVLFIIVMWVGNCQNVYSQELESGLDKSNYSDPTPFTNLIDNTVSSFSGINLLLQGGGIASTFLLVNSDTDYAVHNYFARNEDQYNAYTIPAVYIGYIAPLALGGGLYLAGMNKDDSKTLSAGCAVLQSSLIAFTYSSVLKAFTGRPNPDHFVNTKDDDKSHTFQFGFMNNGIHYGWPSGHMAVSTAVISSMAYFYHDNKAVKVIGGLVWSYMFFGVVAHEGNTMHWFSDAVAGSLIGFAIGSSVGSDFRRQSANRKSASIDNGAKLSPFVTSECRGLAISLQF